jgi:plasmid stabilization system protein ParE
MASSYQLTEDAVRDLEHTMDFLSQRNPAAAVRLANDLERTFLLLVQWPHLGRRPEDHPQYTVRFWTLDGYTIAYLPETAPLIILSVIHGSRDASGEIEFRLGRLQP